MFFLLPLWAGGLLSDVVAQNYILQKRIFIISAPSGTTIQLKGPYTFFGKTPFTISQNLAGPYKLIATKRGFESKDMKIDFNDYPNQTLTITMQPLSRLKATYRSLLFPGWGQRYKGVSGRGMLFTGLVAGAGIGTLVTRSNYQSDRDDLDAARANYLNSLHQDFATAQAAWTKWQAVHRQAQHSYDRYERALLITSSIWALNVIDAFFLSPGPGQSQKKKVDLSSHIGFPHAQVNLTISF
ncbi:MAG: hypothetical protein ALAOOOJD_00459 [bacterium]|nr:hypothetical protein [bacterium]